MYGNDPAKPGGQTERGQRVFCSDRGQRGGCGKTFSIFLADVLPRHTVRARDLWRLLKELCQGGSVKGSAEELGLPFALETLHHLVSRLRRRLDLWRCRLCERGKAPESSQTEPLLQTVEHLQSVFTRVVCPVSEFQMVFQVPALG